LPVLELNVLQIVIWRRMAPGVGKAMRKVFRKRKFSFRRGMLQVCGSGILLLVLFSLVLFEWGVPGLQAAPEDTYEIAPRDADEMTPLVHEESYGRTGPIVFNHQSALWEQIVLVVNNSSSDWGAVALLRERREGRRSTMRSMPARETMSWCLITTCQQWRNGEICVEFRAEKPSEGLNPSRFLFRTIPAKSESYFGKRQACPAPP
jgi:hypothetical protein